MTNDERAAMMELARRIAEQCPAVEVEWTAEERERERKLFESLSPEEQELRRDGMICT